jgi:hypothetical protein
MYGSKKIEKSFLNNYYIKKVFYKDELYKPTLKYLKKQKHLRSSKVLILLNSFINKKYPICYILIYENTIVGFVGTIFSKKVYSKKENLNCNIHSWMVDARHRIASSLLFKKIKERNCLITVLSSLSRLSKTFIKMGFKKFTLKYKLVFIKKILKNKMSSKFYILQDKVLIKNLLNNNLQKILNDYSNKEYEKFIFGKNKSGESCFIIAKKTYKKKIFKTLNIIYCSNPSFLKKNIVNFYSNIEKKFHIILCGEFYLKKNNSLLGNSVGLSLIKNKQVYFSTIPKNFKFDLLYSEVDF